MTYTYHCSKCGAVGGASSPGVTWMHDPGVCNGYFEQEGAKPRLEIGQRALVSKDAICYDPCTNKKCPHPAAGTTVTLKEWGKGDPGNKNLNYQTNHWRTSGGPWLIQEDFLSPCLEPAKVPDRPCTRCRATVNPTDPLPRGGFATACWNCGEKI
jgi:hypothetical protein